MDQKKQKYIKITLYISVITALIGAVAVASIFKGPAVIGAFFGFILGFFAPWMVALISYSIYAMSNPLEAFKDEVKKLEERSKSEYDKSI
ncbi:MAG: hypothetical protein JXQ76_13045 [Campylobacterales bacterium]|nr:hypothetical protein [Campylobacterales bacterium]